MKIIGFCDKILTSLKTERRMSIFERFWSQSKLVSSNTSSLEVPWVGPTHVKKVSPLGMKNIFEGSAQGERLSSRDFYDFWLEKVRSGEYSFALEFDDDDALLFTLPFIREEYSNSITYAFKHPKQANLDCDTVSLNYVSITPHGSYITEEPVLGELTPAFLAVVFQVLPPELSAYVSHSVTSKHEGWEFLWAVTMQRYNALERERLNMNRRRVSGFEVEVIQPGRTMKTVAFKPIDRAIVVQALHSMGNMRERVCELEHKRHQSVLHTRLAR